MLFLILCILANVGIFLVFRSFGIFKINTLSAIVVNYTVCVITGVLFKGDISFVKSLNIMDTWMLIALVLGGVFIGTFYLMARTTQLFSVTVSSIASKMSLAIPVLFSLFVLKIESKPFTYINYIGIAFAFFAILLSSVKSSKEPGHIHRGALVFLMPVLVFLFGGVIDTSINYVNYKFLTTNEEAIFPIVIFAAAMTLGVITLIVKQNLPDKKSIIGGTVLGVINYFSIYSLIKTLNVFDNDGAIVYPVINIGIILVSSLCSVLLFHEKLLNVNKIGLLMAVLAIFMISYQEILGYLN